ncbi:RNA polymerase sigma factor [Schauerella aestuarii]|uniref:RNA polymerase sigma factor n=1 Tax=Schauerella aestuarii TaxID=2511204 RepID=UPI00136F0851|nr:sigma-70 family RNA polymerase sigma factor [Achromobacter aestuarii]MYZ42099.1 sigma-70 family RNA polymerase sigma factor [Achromobacter aestuarii]
MADPAHLESLLADCARQRQPALAELYRLTAPHLFPLAKRMLRSKEGAEEVLQECFVTIWQRAAQYSAEQSQVMTWMTRIVRNRCIDRLRRPDLEVSDPDGEIAAAWADDAPGPMSQLQSSQESKRLADCMQTLEGQQRAAIAMAFFDDLSHPEVAERMAAPLGTVKSWVRRGLARLKECLG